MWTRDHACCVWIADLFANISRQNSQHAGSVALTPPSPTHQNHLLCPVNYPSVNVGVGCPPTH